MTGLIVLGCRIAIAVCAQIINHLDPDPHLPDFAAWDDELATPTLWEDET